VCANLRDNLVSTAGFQKLHCGNSPDICSDFHLDSFRYHSKSCIVGLIPLSILPWLFCTTLLLPLGQTNPPSLSSVASTAGGGGGGGADSKWSTWLARAHSNKSGGAGAERVVEENNNGGGGRMHGSSTPKGGASTLATGPQAGGGEDALGAMNSPVVAHPARLAAAPAGATYGECSSAVEHLLYTPPPHGKADPRSKQHQQQQHRNHSLQHQTQEYHHQQQQQHEIRCQIQALQQQLQQADKPEISHHHTGIHTAYSTPGSDVKANCKPGVDGGQGSLPSSRHASPMGRMLGRLIGQGIKKAADKTRI